VYWTRLTERDEKKKAADPEVEAEKILKDESTFPPRLNRAFTIVISPFWDYLYLSIFIAFLIIIALVDSKSEIPADIYSNLSSPNVLIALLLIMFISQITPVIGIIYFMRYHNVITHIKAQEDFGKWAFLTVLLAQYIEHFYYGGVKSNTITESAILG
jgi:hypothetical protein